MRKKLRAPSSSYQRIILLSATRGIFLTKSKMTSSVTPPRIKAKQSSNENMPQSQDLTYIIKHVFLPSKLPQKGDSDASKDNALFCEYAKAWVLFKDHVLFSEALKWACCTHMLSKMRGLREFSGCPIAAEFEEVL